LIQSFYRLDDFTGLVAPDFSLGNYAQLLAPASIDIFTRTALMAFLVTLACVVLGFPLAYFAARHASPRAKAMLYLAVLLPLWSAI
jgi:putative spermidine/putrescine transport system permease protein